MYYVYLMSIEITKDEAFEKATRGFVHLGAIFDFRIENPKHKYFCVKDDITEQGLLLGSFDSITKYEVVLLRSIKFFHIGDELFILHFFNRGYYTFDDSLFPEAHVPFYPIIAIPQNLSDDTYNKTALAYFKRFYCSDKKDVALNSFQLQSDVRVKVYEHCKKIRALEESGLVQTEFIHILKRLARDGRLSDLYDLIK